MYAWSSVGTPYLIGPLILFGGSMQECISYLIMLVIVGTLLVFSFNRMVAEYNKEKEKAFQANCEFHGGHIKKDSYGTLHCMRKIVG